MGFEWQMNPHRERTWHRGGQAPGDQAPSFHRGLSGYSPSELRVAPELAEAMRVGTVFLKVETERFGLPAFKILGASWAAEQLLAGRDLEGVTLVTATDGNHGRAVARVARMRGVAAHILVPAGTAPGGVGGVAGGGAPGGGGG